MNIFANYAKYYDLLYQDKDYEGEARFINQLISTYAPNTNRLLELGSGTGRHAILLAKSGIRVHGIEKSPEMLAQCQSRCDDISLAMRENLTFTQGDLRTCAVQEYFDAVVSLFHVISYQIKNEDLIAAFRTARKHLNFGGVFIFDVWYGPAVLHTPPEVRIKRLENEKYRLIRIAEPTTHDNRNVVDVNYQILIQHKKSMRWESMVETHRMRYLFKPELDYLLHTTGFKLLDTCHWLTGKEVGNKTWGACFIAQAN